MALAIDSASSAPVPEWEHNLRLHTQLSTMAIKTDSKQDLHAFETAQFTTTLTAAAADPVQDDVRAKLGAILIGIVQDVQSAATDCTDKDQKLKGTTPDPPAWQMTINNAYHQATKNFAETVDTANNNVVNYIMTLAPDSQAAAAAMYSGGMTIVNNAINAVSGFLCEIIDSIEDFLDGVLDKITSVISSVDNACKAAVKALAGFLGLASKTDSFVLRANVTTNQARQNEILDDSLLKAKPASKPVSG